jgi:hypothetical protein
LNKDSGSLAALSSQYISFLLHAFNENNGWFRNFMSYDRQWLEASGSEDAHGRALWGLGKAISYLPDPNQLAVCTTLFNKALTAAELFEYPRAMAFSLIGIHAYLEKFSGDLEARRVRAILADKLLQRFKANATKDWPWLEPVLSYDNGKIAHALLLSGQWLQCTEMIETGLQALSWLLKIQTENGHFVPVGCHGWYEKGGIKARFDQQPIEAHSMLDACIEAYHVTSDNAWINHATMCFNWFLGHNDLNLPLYDPNTGGCRDGLTPNGINQNQGAESTLAWLLSLVSLQKVQAGQAAIPSSTKTQLISIRS